MRRRDHIDHADDQLRKDERAADHDRRHRDDGPVTWPLKSNRLGARDVSDPGNTKQKDHSHERT